MLSLVALRKESVDRNHGKYTDNGLPLESLSARRAWIEIIKLLSCTLCCGVALRKESVDRNSKR